MKIPGISLCLSFGLFPMSHFWLRKSHPRNPCGFPKLRQACRPPFSSPADALIIHPAN